jgi:hypothetical protein
MAQVLTVWRDCDALEASRRGINDFSTPTVAITALVQNGRPVRLPIPRATFIKQFAAMFSDLAKNDDFNDAVDQEARKRFDSSVGQLVEQLGVRLELNPGRDLRVLAQDDSAVYISMVNSMDASSQRTVIGSVVAITKLNGIAVDIAFFSDYNGGPNLTSLLATAQTIMRQLVNANDFPNRINI